MAVARVHGTLFTYPTRLDGEALERIGFFLGGGGIKCLSPIRVDKEYQTAQPCLIRPRLEMMGGIHS